VDFYNEQARQLGASPVSGFPEIACPPAGRIFAVIHPFASNLAKRAPVAIFEAAARKLGATMPVYWLCGPEEELPGAMRIPDLYQLARWLRQARIFVGNDSGISHLAAAVGTPVQAFFRTTDPRIWAPRGSSVNITKI
jgi:ADP-heptose:LPS heptosyltransferase